MEVVWFLGSLLVTTWALVGLIRLYFIVIPYIDDTLDLVGVLAHNDIAEGRKWQWRFEEFRKYNIHSGTLLFWRPLEKMWSNTDFLKA